MGHTKHQPAKVYRLKVISALLVSVWSIQVLALDLGRIQVQSAIGEPLRAEIEIIEASTEELRSLRAQLGSPNAFRQAGLEYNPSLAGVTASLHGRNNGSFYVALRGQNLVQDTFIDLILEMQWATGRLVKNYALLLNSVSTPATSSASSTQAMPAVTAATMTNSRVSAALLSVAPPPPLVAPSVDTVKTTLNPASIELNDKNVPVYRFAPAEGRPQIRVTEQAPGQAQAFSSMQAPAVKADPSAIRPARSTRAASNVRPSAPATPATNAVMTVMRGDTASRLALRHLGPDISLDQMLLALLKANPDAFIEGNVNLLKAGASLRIPSATEAAAIPLAEARQRVMAQARDFADYKVRLAGSASMVGSKNTREMTGKVGLVASRAEEKAPQQDKLTLSKPVALGTAPEIQVAKEQERKDTSEQLAALSKNLQDLENLAKGSVASIPVNINAPVSDTATLPTPLTPAPSMAEANASKATEFKDSLVNQIIENRSIWAWGAALLTAMLLFVIWLRRAAKPAEEVYVPSYGDKLDDGIEPTSATAAFTPSSIPPQMSSIDLNLTPQEPVMNGEPLKTSAQMVYPVPAPTQANKPPPSEETQKSKLEMAGQLLSAGDQDLARALILSVASTAQGDIKARALQMLGQIK
jgi:pilus assembly protein FimV